jgi:hypothetical protein
LFGVEEHSGVVLIVIGFAVFTSVGWVGFLRTVVMNTILVMDGDLFMFLITAQNWFALC